MSADVAADVLASARSKHVRIWTENGHLHYKAPKGALTRAEIERMRAFKEHIVALLESDTRQDRAPLAFSQQAHWDAFQLSERRALRQIASATRLRGRPNIEALRRSVAEMVHRHEALRTRVLVADGTPYQEIVRSLHWELEIDDLSQLPLDKRESAVMERIQQLILQPIDICTGPLFGVYLLKTHDDEHVLVIVMEHLICDGFSRNILLRDLFTAYGQISRGQPVSLPPISLRFIDYARRQRDGFSAWSKEHEPYWSRRLSGCGRVRFPEDQDAATVTHFGWTAVSLHISREKKAELLEWCRRRRTTLVMSIFTAYVAFVLRWCDSHDAVFKYQTDGRTTSGAEHTVGYFATLLFLRVELRADESYADLLNRVTAEYCSAYDHADFSYIASRLPRLEFTRNTLFNWLPRAEPGEAGYSTDEIDGTPVAFKPPMVNDIEMDNEPSVLFVDSEDGIVGDVYFPLHRFSVPMMERFAGAFLTFVDALLRESSRPLRSIPID